MFPLTSLNFSKEIPILFVHVSSIHRQYATKYFVGSTAFKDCVFKVRRQRKQPQLNRLISCLFPVFTQGKNIFADVFRVQ